MQFVHFVLFQVESFLSKRTLGMIDLEESQPEAIRKVSVVTQNGITFQTLLSPLVSLFSLSPQISSHFLPSRLHIIKLKRKSKK